MSSFNPTTMHALPWALDELAVPESFYDFVAEPSHVDTAEHEVDVQSQMAAELARLEAQAFARGRAEGVRDTRAVVDAELSKAVAAVYEAATLVKLHESRWVANAEENIAALAVAVARHIVQHEVTVDPDSIRTLVSRALVQLPVDQPIVARLHPDDMAACSTLVSPDANGRTPEIRWVADANIMRGGCLVEGRERIIDGRIDTSLERVYRNIGNRQA